jgi:hypothetical protein
MRACLAADAHIAPTGSPSLAQASKRDSWGGQITLWKMTSFEARFLSLFNISNHMISDVFPVLHSKHFDGFFKKVSR